MGESIWSMHVVHLKHKLVHLKGVNKLYSHLTIFQLRTDHSMEAGNSP